ncbi:MAG: hypothetical protein KF861_15160, partial [Planctomycetaceae bacterium]|nr:hypothetical protein [Planctomycetaceae bacterium]
MRLMTSVAILLSLLGCGDLGLTQSEPEPAAEPAPAAPVEPAAAPVQEKPATVTHFLKREAALVDKHKAMAENDKLVEVENRITANDYLSAVSQMYFAAGSAIYLSQLKHQLDLMYAQDNRYPTFEEFSALLKQFNIKLGALYEYQMYAYDDQTGEIGILEDRAHMKRIYEAAGR